MRPPDWTESELEILSDAYEKHGGEASRYVNEQLPHRSRRACQNKAYNLGLTKGRKKNPHDSRGEERLEKWYRKYRGLCDPYDQFEIGEI